MTPKQLLDQLKVMTQAGRYAFLHKTANQKILKQSPK
jgi:hypothetical protein